MRERIDCTLAPVVARLQTLSWRMRERLLDPQGMGIAQYLLLVAIVVMILVGGVSLILYCMFRQGATDVGNQMNRGIQSAGTPAGS